MIIYLHHFGMPDYLDRRVPELEEFFEKSGMTEREIDRELLKLTLQDTSKRYFLWSMEG